MHGKVRDGDIPVTQHCHDTISIGTHNETRRVSPDGVVGVQREGHAQVRETLREHQRFGVHLGDLGPSAHLEDGDLHTPKPKLSLTREQSAPIS